MGETQLRDRVIAAIGCRAVHGQDGVYCGHDSAACRRVTGLRIRESLTVWRAIVVAWKVRFC